VTTVIRCLALANGEPGPSGQFLEKYDVTSGFSEWTPNLERAQRFETRGEAVAMWQSVLPSQPTRPWDGKPNRPLTAFTCEFVDVETLT
jgi:hypothetical protein